MASQEFIAVPGAREFSLHFGTDENLHALIADLAEVSISSLVRAITEFREAIQELYIWMYFYDLEPSSFNPDVSPSLPFNLECTHNHFWVRARFDDLGEVHPLLLKRIMTPLLEQNKARPLRVEKTNEFGRETTYYTYEYKSLRGLRVRDVAHLASKVSALASAIVRHGDLDPTAIEALVLSGHADLLVGQSEHQQFEAKSTGYSSDPDNQLELVKDVASFANSSEGGIIVCGLRTAKRQGSDRVIKTIPVSLSGVRSITWIRTIRRLLVPAPEGLRVESIRSTDSGSPKGYVAISIPPQPEHLKPFLVKAARRANRKINETDIAIPVRIGEHTEYADAAAIHGLLTAGRAALRDGSAGS